MRIWHKALLATISSLLFLSSSLKTYDFLQEYSQRQELHFSLYRNLLVAQLQLAVCALIIFRASPVLVSKLLIGMFAIFSLKSGVAVWFEERSCGCFGAHVLVSPTVMLCGDLLILLALLLLMAQQHRDSHNDYDFVAGATKELV